MAGGRASSRAMKIVHSPKSLCFVNGIRAVELAKRRVLDLRGYVCPYPQLATLKALRSMEPGEELEVVTDNPPSVQNVPAIAKKEGHEVVGVYQIGEGLWKIVIRKR